MGIIADKRHELNQHIQELNRLRWGCVDSDTDFLAVAKEAEKIVKLAYFLESYKELDKEREASVKETVMGYLNEQNTYDSALIESLGYCFGEYD